MSTGMPDLFAAAMALPEGERASLAFELLNSLRPPGIMSEDDPGFFEELDRRVDAYERGETVASDWEEVQQRLRQALKDRRLS